MKKALTIKQPWAALIMLGIKDIENRTWKTDYRGRLFIHSSKKSDKIDLPDILMPSDISIQLTQLIHVNGCIIGEVQLIECISPDEFFKSDWHEPGCWGWYLENPKLINPPIQCKGKQGLWDYEPDQL